MRLRAVLVVSICLFAIRLNAAPIALNYSVIGTGGQAAQGWWVNEQGALLREPLTDAGFDAYPFIARTGGDETDESVGSIYFSMFGVPSGVGSLLVSSAFDLDNGDALTVDFSVMDNLFFMVEPGAFGFAALLHEGELFAYLGGSRPTPHTLTWQNHNLGTNWNFPRPSDGVDLTMVAGPTTEMTLGDITYGGPRLAPGFCAALEECQATLVSTLTPGAGQYQLLFGVVALYATQDNPIPNGTTLLVNSVAIQADEPPTRVLALGAIAMMFVSRRHPRIQRTR